MTYYGRYSAKNVLCGTSVILAAAAVLFTLLSAPVSAEDIAPLIGPPLIITETYVVTAYALGDGYTPRHGITASGERVQPLVTAACPREIPLGTHIIVDGVGQRVCLDRGSAVRGKHVDLYVPNVRTARQFGRQTLDVAVITPL